MDFLGYFEETYENVSNVAVDFALKTYKRTGGNLRQMLEASLDLMDEIERNTKNGFLCDTAKLAVLRILESTVALRREEMLEHIQDQLLKLEEEEEYEELEGLW